MRNVSVFSEFSNNYSILTQNQCHIRNRRQKLHRITYVLTEIFFSETLVPRGPQAKV